MIVSKCENANLAPIEILHNFVIAPYTRICGIKSKTQTLSTYIKSFIFMFMSCTVYTCVACIIILQHVQCSFLKVPIRSFLPMLSRLFVLLRISVFPNQQNKKTALNNNFIHISWWSKDLSVNFYDTALMCCAYEAEMQYL